MPFHLNDLRLITPICLGIGDNRNKTKSQNRALEPSWPKIKTIRKNEN